MRDHVGVLCIKCGEKWMVPVTIKVARPLLFEGEPGVLSDAIITICEGNPSLRSRVKLPIIFYYAIKVFLGVFMLFPFKGMVFFPVMYECQCLHTFVLVPVHVWVPF